MYVLLTEIEAPSAVMRAGVSEEGMKDLVKSIKENGLINPVVIRKKGGKYELITGYRRMLAHEKLGMEKILVRVVKADDLKAEGMKIDENREREDVNPLDEGVYFLGVMRLQGWNQKELSKAFRYSEAYVSQRVSSIDWPEILRDAIIDGKINFSVARELAGVRDPGELEALVIMAVKSGVTPGVAVRWRQEANRTTNDVTAADDGGVGSQAGVEGRQHKVGCTTCGRGINAGEIGTLVVCLRCLGLIRTATKEGVFVEKEGE